MRLLIDECLSPALVALANALGYEAAHVVHLGLAGKKDWEIMEVVLEGDWTLVTRNAIDFRGRRRGASKAARPGPKGHYKGVDLHAGLICLNSPGGLDLKGQEELFGVALKELETCGEPVNQVIEVTLSGDGCEGEGSERGTIEIDRYDMPDQAS